MLHEIVADSTACGFFGRYQTGYEYSVRGAYNGQWSCRIDTIGDKKGGMTVHYLLGDRKGLSKEKAIQRFGEMLDMLQVPALKVVVVLTNDKHGSVRQARDILLNEMSWPRKMPGGQATSIDTLEVEDFACRPESWLRKLCRFVGLDEDEDYLEKATAMVDTRYCHNTGDRSNADRRKGHFSVPHRYDYDYDYEDYDYEAYED